jgi:uncharacterized protein (DUF1810 family)
MSDPHHLSRFLDAQESSYPQALAELQQGRKRSHWMWYIFPQLAGLGRSVTAQYYGIKSLAEARAYLAHPVLGPRLVACCEAVLAIPDRSAHDIFGSPDDLKLRSCATLFAGVTPAGSVFERLLDKHYPGANGMRRRCGCWGSRMERMISIQDDRCSDLQSAPFSTGISCN